MSDWAAFERVVRANAYMVVATADASGAPWASPVWFATDDCRTFYWVSKPVARHSQNLASRADLAITIFDSTQAPGTGSGVYVAADGGLVPDDELTAAVAVYSAASERAGLSAWSRSDVTGDAPLRLYRATAREQFVLTSGDQRVAVGPAA